MRSLLILFSLMIISWDNISAQSIEGDTVVCPGTVHSYTIGEDTCTEGISNIVWQITTNSGVNIGGSTSNLIAVTWDVFSSGATSGTLGVTYDCYFIGPDETIDTAQVEVEIHIDILSLQQPLFSFSTITLTCNNDSVLTIVTPDQGGVAGTDVIYTWTYPQCFGFNGGNSTGVFTADKASGGEICLTVYIPDCNTSITECFTVVRRCEDYVTYTPSNPISDPYTSRNININTVGAVSSSVFSSVEFKAGQAINLGPGFIGVPNFLAHIAPCTCFPNDSVGCYHRPSHSSSQNENALSEQSYNIGNNEQKQGVQKESTYVKVFPNPTNNLLTIEIKKFNESNPTYLILSNMDGIELFVQKINATQFTLNLSEYKSGIYFLKVYDETHSSRVKVIKLD